MGLKQELRIGVFVVMWMIIFVVGVVGVNAAFGYWAGPSWLFGCCVALNWTFRKIR